MEAKKVTALVLATLTAFSAMTGCSAKETETTAAKTSAAQTPATKAPASNPTAADNKAETNNGNAVVFPLTQPASYEVFAASDANDIEIKDALFMKKSLENTNLDLDITHLLVADAKEKRSLLLNSGDYPAVFYKGGFSADDLEKYGAQEGIFIPLEDLIREHAPNLTAYLDANNGWNYITSSDGSVYSLPNINIQYCSEDMTYWLNWVWMDQLGMKEPTSFDELYEVLKAFKENDMNGDGDANNEIPLACYTGGASPRTLLCYADYGWDSKTNLIVDDTGVSYLPIDERYKEFLAYLAKLYKDGILYDQCYTADSASITAMGNEGLLGSFFGWGAHPVVGDNLTTGLDSNYLILTPFQDGTYPIGTGYKVGTLTLTDKCKNPEIIIAWADQFYSEEGGILATMGVEGETYKILEDGTWNWILDGNYGDTVGKVRDHTANGGTQFPAKWPDFWYDKMSPEVGSEVYLNEQRIKSGSHGKVLLPTMRYTTEQTEELAGLVVAIKAYMDEYEANVVTGKLDLEDSWEEYLNTMKAMGAERVAEIYSDVYAVSKK